MLYTHIYCHYQLFLHPKEQLWTFQLTSDTISYTFQRFRLKEKWKQSESFDENKSDLIDNKISDFNIKRMYHRNGHLYTEYVGQRRIIYFKYP